MVSAVAMRAERLGYAGGAPVLVDLDVTIGEGERVALVGGNGAGKTTLLRALVGLFAELRGEVRLWGERVRAPEDAVALGAALVFQQPDDQLFGATVREDVMFGPRNQGLSIESAKIRADEALSALGIGPLAGRRIETLSFGEKRRACLAGVLAMRPRLLLLDEPTAGLDPAGEVAFVELLRGLSGLTLVVATHAVDLVPYLASRVLVLGERRILNDGPVAQVMAQAEALAQARVRQPTVTRLGALLGAPAPLPLSVEEATERWALR